MASAPQKPTLSAGFTIGAPPAPAPSAPSATRKTIAAAGTAFTTTPSGARNAVSVGAAAPTENASADANAAWIGLGCALVQAELVARMGVERVLGHELIDDLLGELRFQAPLFVDVGKLARLCGRAARAPGRPPRNRPGS